MSIKPEDLEPSDEVFVDAATWAARLESGQFDDDDRATLQFWLGADNRHVIAFRRMQSIMNLTEGLEESAGISDALVIQDKPKSAVWL